MRHCALYREGRFEIAPSVRSRCSTSTGERSSSGARLNYNITDWLAIGVWGGGGVVSSTTDLTDKIDNIAPRDALTASQRRTTRGDPRTQDDHDVQRRSPAFADQTAKISYVVVAAAHVHPVPRQARHLQQDLRRHGPLPRRRRRRSSASRSAATAAPGRFRPTCSDPALVRRSQSKTKIAPTFGLGLTFYPSNFVSFGVEYRALPFSWNRAGFDSRGVGPERELPGQQGQRRRRDLQVQSGHRHFRRRDAR